LKICELGKQGRHTKLQPKGHGMERSSKRGKIPQQDWPLIMARYGAGETLASIARTYDCSPPAISYIVSRNRARIAPSASGTQSTHVSSEPQLVKGHASETLIREEPPPSEEITDDTRAGLTLDSPHRAEGSASEEPQLEKQLSRPQSDPSLQEGERLVEGYRSAQENANEENGNPPQPFDPAGVPSQNSEPRRTLHLQLFHENDTPAGPEPQPRSVNSANISGERNTARAAGGQQSLGYPGRQGADYHPRAGNGEPPRTVSQPQVTRDGGAFIDQALRERVESDIAAFLAAFDAALIHDTPESRAGLREATDRLLRAGARTRIELERLEARVPLPSRNSASQLEPTWRQR
jgi:hypothetical protein